MSEYNTEQFAERLKDQFDEMVVFKDLKKSNFISSFKLPSFMRDWVLKRFQDDDGNIDTEGAAEFIKEFIPKKEDWKSIMNRVVSYQEQVRFLAKISVNIDIKTQLCRIAHAHGALFHTDAVQALGHIPVDVKSLGVDMLSGSAHKFGGPKGAGFLYVRSGTPLTPYADGGAQEHGLRAGTENVAAAVGMAAALKKSCAAMPETAEKLRRMERDLLAELWGVDFIRNGAPDGIPGNMSLSFRGAEGEMLLHRLDLMGICVSTGSACDSARTQISHVLDAMGVPEEYAAGTIRVSFGAGNSPEDGKLVGQAIRKIIG